MSRRLVAALCVALIGSVGAMAQNARTDALGLNPALTDFLNVLYNPAYMVDYKDALQATYDGAVGPVLGIKSLGKVVSAGLTYTGAQVFNANPVYADLLTVVNSIPGVALPAGTPDPIPHFLVGFNAGPVGIGLDLYYERSRYSYYNKDVVAGVPPALPVTTEETIDASIDNPGLRVGASVTMDAFWLGAVIGASMPGISGERTLKDNATGPTLTTTGKASSEHHYAMDGVVEGGFSVKGFDLSLGLNGGWLTYQGMIVNTPPGGPPATARDDIRDNINIGGYVGVQKKLGAHNLTMAVGEATNFYMVTNEPDVIDAFTYDPGKTTANTINFYFAGSVEKEWSSLKWLDAVIGRAALSYGVNTIIGHEDGAAAGSSHELRQRLVTGRTGLGLTMGLGVRKGVFGVDVNVAPMAVLNAFKLVTGNYAANDLGTITLNLDFGTLKTKSGSADIESAPTPVPRGATPSTTPAF